MQIVLRRRLRFGTAALSESLWPRPSAAKQAMVPADVATILVSLVARTGYPQSERRWSTARRATSFAYGLSRPAHPCSEERGGCWLGEALANLLDRALRRAAPGQPLHRTQSPFLGLCVLDVKRDALSPALRRDRTFQCFFPRTFFLSMSLECLLLTSAQLSAP